MAWRWSAVVAFLSLSRSMRCCCRYLSATWSKARIRDLTLSGAPRRSRSRSRSSRSWGTTVGGGVLWANVAGGHISNAAAPAISRTRKVFIISIVLFVLGIIRNHFGDPLPAGSFAAPVPRPPPPMQVASCQQGSTSTPGPKILIGDFPPIRPQRQRPVRGLAPNPASNRPVPMEDSRDGGRPCRHGPIATQYASRFTLHVFPILLAFRQTVSQIIARNTEQPGGGGHVVAALCERLLNEDSQGGFQRSLE